MSAPFACFKCQDENTPLYCLNCANEELKAQLDSLHNAIFRAFGALPGVSAEELVEAKGERIAELEAQLAQREEQLRRVGDDEIEERVITKIRQRRDAGRAKYGTTMERTDLPLEQWLNHAQEEALDLAVYLEKLKRTPPTGYVKVEQYNELLYAVESKFPNETRHQTALRYIQEAESRTGTADESLKEGKA